MPRRISVIGVPSSAGGYANGQEAAPAALRAAGLVDRLRHAGADVDDTGDSPVWRWRPDRTRPRAQNLEAVIDQVVNTRKRVAQATAQGGSRSFWAATARSEWGRPPGCLTSTIPSD